MRNTVIFAVGLSLAAPLAQADAFYGTLKQYFDDEVTLWIGDPLIIGAIKAQNQRNEGLQEADVLALDGRWRKEVKESHQPTITPVITGEVADFLRAQIENSWGVVSEVFIMDNHGLNVAASGITSDYWQGDEAKFTESYGRGAGAIHVGDVEFDDSVGAYQGQVSAPIVDPVTQAVIGAITVGLNAEMLF